MNYCSKKILDLLVERQHKDHHKDSTYKFPIFLVDLPLIKNKTHHRTSRPWKWRRFPLMIPLGFVEPIWLVLLTILKHISYPI